MSIGPVIILNISTVAALAILGAALALLVMVQDPQRRSNQYFALCMAIFAVFGAVATAWQVPQQFNLEPEPLLYTLTTLYAVGLVMLFNFVTTFAGMPRRLRWVERAISVPVTMAFVILLWSDRVYANFEPMANGGYEHEVQAWGYAGAGFVMVYLVFLLGYLHQRDSTRTRELALPVTALVVGVIAFFLTHTLRTYAVIALATMVSIVLLGRLVLKYQVFQPLQDLNDELIAKNNELAQATLMKSQFLANMSHELRTPLNSIIGYAELVLTGTYGPLSDLQEDRLRKVMRNGRLLLELINDVLDLSKIEAGRLDLSFDHVSTIEVLDRVLEEFTPEAVKKGLTLVRGYSHLPNLWADESRVHQMLSNLLSNAIKFTEQGAVIVRGHFDIQRQQIVISVTDTGVGIDPEYWSGIFEAFRHVDDPLTRQVEGTGLGLAITSRLAELHGGCLWFESAVGQGTTFFIALPAVEDLYQPVPILEPKPRTRGPVILGIDNDYEALEVLQGHLEPHHFRVYGAANANDGLRLARELKPALITLDLEMPDISGWQVLEVLRHDPETAHIPVLIITASQSGSMADLTGAAGLLTKPVPPQALLDHVRRLVPVRQEA
jgi:signal transduction histidine kinase